MRGGIIERTKTQSILFVSVYFDGNIALAQQTNWTGRGQAKFLQDYDFCLLKMNSSNDNRSYWILIKIILTTIRILKP